MDGAWGSPGLREGDDIAVPTSFGHKPKSKCLKWLILAKTNLISLSNFAGLFVPQEKDLSLDFHLAFEKLLLVPFSDRKCAEVNTDEARLQAHLFCYPRHLHVNPGKWLIYSLGRSLSSLG